MDETLLERLTDQIAANEAPVDTHAKVDQLAASTVLLREVVAAMSDAGGRVRRGDRPGAR